uniref:Uncharacterized protein n=1 Tax=viral metagenome TaxID=1070528 RepID=A0A2V0RMJ9_9ZZZZ
MGTGISGWQGNYNQTSVNAKAEYTALIGKTFLDPNHNMLDYVILKAQVNVGEILDVLIQGVEEALSLKDRLYLWFSKINLASLLRSSSDGLVITFPKMLLVRVFGTTPFQMPVAPIFAQYEIPGTQKHRIPPYDNQRNAYFSEVYMDIIVLAGIYLLMGKVSFRIILKFIEAVTKLRKGTTTNTKLERIHNDIKDIQVAIDVLSNGVTQDTEDILGATDDIETLVQSVYDQGVAMSDLIEDQDAILKANFADVDESMDNMRNEFRHGSAEIKELIDDMGEKFVDYSGDFTDMKAILNKIEKHVGSSTLSSSISTVNRNVGRVYGDVQVSDEDAGIWRRVRSKLSIL